MDNKVRILSTVPLEQSLLDKVADHGMEIDVQPFINTLPVIEDSLSNNIKALLAHPLHAMFTSMNAVDVVASNISHQPAGWKIYCIGGATEKAVAEHFGNNAISGTAHNAAELADKIINDNIKEVVFFCGDIRRDELPVKLACAGIAVKEQVVYRTIATPLAIEKEYDSILFFSPSAVNSFFSMNRVASGTTLFAIGKTTAAAIQHFTNNTVIVSDKPGKEDLVDAMIAHYAHPITSNK